MCRRMTRASALVRSVGMEEAGISLACAAVAERQVVVHGHVAERGDEVPWQVQQSYYITLRSTHSYLYLSHPVVCNLLCKCCISCS